MICYFFSVCQYHRFAKSSLSRAAIKWIESYLADPNNQHAKQQKVIKKRQSSVLKRLQSNVSGSAITPWRRMSSFFGDEKETNNDSDIVSEESQNGAKKDNKERVLWPNYLLAFSAGLSIGVLVATRATSK